MSPGRSTEASANSKAPEKETEEGRNHRRERDQKKQNKIAFPTGFVFYINKDTHNKQKS